MHVVIFEGSQWATFAPLCLNRPTFMLSTGMSTLLDKQIRYLGATRVSFWVRPELVDFCKVRVIPQLKIPATVNEPLDDQPALLVNGRTLFFRTIDPPPEEGVVMDEPHFVRVAYVKNRAGFNVDDVMQRTQRWLDLLELPKLELGTRLAESLADLISWNEESLIEDSTQLLKVAKKPKLAGPFYLVNEDDVWIGKDVNVCSGVVLDASLGSVVLAEGVNVG